MSTLSDLLPEENELVVSLPYKAGVWMSHADDVKGSEDDKREMHALEGVIKAMAKLNKKSDFVRDVARETLDQKKYWPLWHGQVDAFSTDCKKAIAFLKDYVSKEDLHEYRLFLWRIANGVAQAHSEPGCEKHFNENLISGFFEKIAEKLGAEDHEAYLNISTEEKSALSRLKEALR